MRLSKNANKSGIIKKIYQSRQDLCSSYRFMIFYLNIIVGTGDYIAEIEDSVESRY